MADPGAWAYMAAKQLTETKRVVTDLRKKQIAEKREYYALVIQQAIDRATSEKDREINKMVDSVDKFFNAVAPILRSYRRIDGWKLDHIRKAVTTLTLDAIGVPEEYRD